MPTAITFSRYGEPDVLTVSPADIPQPGPGQVRVRVHAVAVNLIDVKIRSGHMDGIFPVSFPVTPGWDVAGVVDAAGENAHAAVGDAVFGVASAGGYSDYALLDQPVAMPEGLSMETAAAIVTVGEAAFRGLAHLNVKAGQTLLIHGAAGSVGTIAVQLAVARGITVIGTASTADLERVTALGATAVPYGEGWAGRVRAIAPQGVDAVFDTSGAGVLAESVALPAARTASSPSPTNRPHSTACASPAPTPPTAPRRRALNWPPYPRLASSACRSGGPTRWPRRPARTPILRQAVTTER